MSSPSTSAIVKATMRKKGASRPRGLRSPSASEIARNLGNFETWSTHQGCEQVSYNDIPDDAKADVEQVFDVTGRLPAAWVDNTSEEFHALSLFATPEFLVFVQEAYDLCPTLFSEDDFASVDISEIYAEMTIVFSAWRRLRWMRKSKEKWSEADFVANVYNVFRSPALRESTHRVHCSISLPQPLSHAKMGSQALRILNTKTVIPDCAILIPAATIRSLSHSAKSPFKMLKGQASIVNSGNASKGSSFRYQSTPCAQLPDTPGFEFVSSFWEDKKPVHHMLEDAYRQNRMATAAAVRHLHSLHIKAPIFGLVWAGGIVRAHVDWCKSEEGKAPTILSAPYPGSRNSEVSATEEETSDIFHEWQLDRPSDILQVHFLIRNIDQWTTTGRFRDRVVSGIKDLLENVVHNGERYEPWKRAGDLMHSALANVRKENVNISITTESSASPPKPKSRRHRAR